MRYSAKEAKAVRGMLDVETLHSSKDRAGDIKTAMEALIKSDPWAFGTATVLRVQVGDIVTVQDSNRDATPKNSCKKPQLFA